MIKKVLVLIALVASILSASDYSVEKLTDAQKSTMLHIYEAGKKFDLGLTLAAIAWQESQLGAHPINLSDPSCGVFHVMPSSLIRRLPLKNNAWNRSRLCERLISDLDFSVSAALMELKYWQNYWRVRLKQKNVWKHMVASYNGGFAAGPNSNYVKVIAKKVRIVEQILREMKNDRNACKLDVPRGQRPR